jgi:hypothetical protein
MRFTLVAVVVGLVVGLLAGGRPRHIAGRPFRRWPLLAAGLAVQVASARIGGRPGLVLLVAAYGLLVAFAAVNATRVGMWMVALGIGLNLLAIALNGGMPVRPEAVVAAGIAGPGRVDVLRLDGKRHLERPSDRLLALSDVIPVPPLREVLSFGDLVMGVGLADVLVHLLRPPRRAAHAAAGTAGGPRWAHARPAR